MLNEQIINFMSQKNRRNRPTSYTDQIQAKNASKPEEEIHQIVFKKFQNAIIIIYVTLLR
jgi:hypothetical protein